MFDLQINLHLRFDFAPAILFGFSGIFSALPGLARMENNLHQLLKEILLICSSFFFHSAPLPTNKF